MITFTDAGLRIALTQAIRDGHISPAIAETLGEVLSDAAMSMAVDADENRVASPNLTRKRAALLDRLSLSVEDAIQDASEARQ